MKNMMVIVVVVFSFFSLNAQEQNAIYGGLGSAKKVGGDGDQYLWGRSIELGLRLGMTPTTSFLVLVHHSSLFFDPNKFPNSIQEPTHSVTATIGNFRVRFFEKGITPFFTIGAGLSVENIAGTNWDGSSVEESKISAALNGGIGVDIPLSTTMDLSIMGGLIHSRAYETTFIPVTIGLSFYY
jgi:hypothetical protein